MLIKQTILKTNRSVPSLWRGQVTHREVFGIGLLSVLLILLIGLVEHFVHGQKTHLLSLIFFLFLVHNLFVFVLHLKQCTLIWFFVFLGKKLLSMWKSVPYFLSIISSISVSSWVQILDFSFNSMSMVWVLGLLEMDDV